MKDDLIKRSDAIKVVRHASMEFVDADTRQKLIEAVPSADRPQEWIPCSERLPSKNGKYLIVGRQGAVNILPYRDGRWYGRWGVLAWMPLPKPWKGAEDETTT